MSISVKRGGDWVQCAGNGTLYADAPLGTILAYGGAVAPSGWFICDGTAISRTTYSELFAVIGTAFGAGNGSTTFNLPDMRESVPKGAGLTGKTAGAHLDADGLAVGEFLDDRVQDHTHTFGSADSQVGLSDYSAYYKGLALSNGNGVKYNTNSNTGRKGNTTEVKSVGVNYIIKAKMIGVPTDFMSKANEAVSEVFDSGLAHLSAIQSNTKSEQTILFNKTFSTPPIVVCNLYGAYYSDELSLSAVLDVTTTDFKVRVTNTYAQGALAPYVSWLAKG